MHKIWFILLHCTHTLTQGVHMQCAIYIDVRTYSRKTYVHVAVCTYVVI